MDLATVALLGKLAGCFDVSYAYFEAAQRPPQVLAQKEWIEVAADDAKIEVVHYRYQGDQRKDHFHESWRQLTGGAWEQTVLGADGAVRYYCAARFLMNSWRCAVAGTPKPRRDTGRSDYAVLDRDSTVQITEGGWVQSERNGKRTADGRLVATEAGWNAYTRLGDEQCPR